MIQIKQSLTGHISVKQTLTGKMNNAVVKEYPELEDIVITPTDKEQEFKSKEYGYNNIKVKAVEGENITITPSDQEQVYEGIYTRINVNSIEAEELNIIPSAEEQTYSGLYSNITVEGDSNLTPENIAEGKSIFGVKGKAKTSNVKITDASRLFYSNARIDYLNEFLAMCENLITTTYMFSGASKITELDLSNLDTSNVTTMSYMFNSASGLTELDLSHLNTSNVTDVSYMFNMASSIITLDFSNLDFGKVKSIGNILYNTTKLENLKSFTNLGKSYTSGIANYGNYTLNLSTSPKLTYESLIDIINNLYDLNLSYKVATGGILRTQTLNLGTTNIAKLTAEEINVAVQKGWTVS